MNKQSIMLGKLDDYGCIPRKEENVPEIQLDLADVVHWSENPPKGEPDPYEAEEATSEQQAKLSKIDAALNKPEDKKRTNKAARKQAFEDYALDMDWKLLQHLEQTQPDLIPKNFSPHRINELYNRHRPQTPTKNHSSPAIASA